MLLAMDDAEGKARERREGKSESLERGRGGAAMAGVAAEASLDEWRRPLLAVAVVGEAPWTELWLSEDGRVLTLPRPPPAVEVSIGWRGLSPWPNLFVEPLPSS